MKLPRYKEAIVPKQKLTKYLLSETHAVGSAKAKFFRNLGFNLSNVDELKKAFLKIVQTNEVKKRRKFEYGINYVVEGIVEAPNGKRVIITTVWFVKSSEGRPRFVTAYPV